MSVTIILTISVFRPSKRWYFRFHHCFCVRNPLKLRYISVFRHEYRSISDFRKIGTPPNKDKMQDRMTFSFGGSEGINSLENAPPPPLGIINDLRAVKYTVIYLKKSNLKVKYLPTLSISWMFSGRYSCSSHQVPTRFEFNRSREDLDSTTLRLREAGLYKRIASRT